MTTDSTIGKTYQWPADKIIRRKVSDLTPFARNARTHDQAQIGQIAASIREWGWTQPIIVDESGGILAGHGRLLAAIHLGLDEVPCVVASGWSEAKRRAYIIADNRLAENAGWDDGMLSAELQDLSALDFDLSLVGFDGEELARLLDGDYQDGQDNEPDTNYSRKIEAPIYEIKGDKPEPNQLFNNEKTRKLIADIEQANLPEDVAQFLKAAAMRHTVFNFAKIAEFYAHADQPLQALMEDSALVIIDFDKAIENGFVRMTNRLASLFSMDYPNGYSNDPEDDADD